MKHIDTIFKFVKTSLKSISYQDYIPHERWREPSFSISDMLVALIYFNHLGCSSFKVYVLEIVPKLFKNISLSYNRWCIWHKKLVHLLEYLAQFSCSNAHKEVTHVIDSTCIPVCAIHRERDHQRFKDIAAKAKSSLGWFYGFKLHLLTDLEGSIINFLLTKGNVHDVQYLKHTVNTLDLSGTLIGDNGYQSKAVKQSVEHKLKVITKPTKKQGLLSEADFQLYKKRWIIESVFNCLKERCALAKAKIFKSIQSFYAHVCCSILNYQIYFS